MESPPRLDFSTLKVAIEERAAALRVVTRLQPIGGAGDKVFPPTFGDTMEIPTRDRTEKSQRTQYAMEFRRVEGTEEPVLTVLLDSVASQANRMEEALLAAWEQGEIEIPMVYTDFRDHDGSQGDDDIGLDDLGGNGRISALEAPHRLADALLRDSVSPEGTLFRLTDEGKAFTDAAPHNATALYDLCPTGLVFGLWDSTGPKGGLGSKFERVLVSEIVGYGVEPGVKTSSRLDPAGIEREAMTIYAHSDPQKKWTLLREEAKKGKKGKPQQFSGASGKSGTPASIVHGNIKPSLDAEAGGVTMNYAVQRTVISLPGLRRLRFPKKVDGTPVTDEERTAAEQAVRTVLAALGVAAIAYQRQEGYDLRSRCAFQPEGPPVIEVLGRAGGVSGRYSLDTAAARTILSSALEQARSCGFGWRTEPLELKPAPKLAELIKASRRIAKRDEEE